MWIKICGWNHPAVLDEMVASGVHSDAIGLNFYRSSPRFIDAEAARSVVSTLPATIEPVGLFVDHRPDEIRRLAESVGLRTLQLHGDYTPEDLVPLRDFRLIRVYRNEADELTPVAADLARCDALGIRPWACLVEPKVEGAYGGSGTRGPWKALSRWNSTWPPLILAGGLTPNNVVEAIGTTRPWGVDTASGVELRRGDKDPKLVRRFIEQARLAGETRSTLR